MNGRLDSLIFTQDQGRSALRERKATGPLNDFASQCLHSLEDPTGTAAFIGLPIRCFGPHLQFAGQIVREDIA